MLITYFSHTLTSYGNVLLDLPSLGSDAAAIKDLDSEVLSYTRIRLSPVKPMLYFENGTCQSAHTLTPSPHRHAHILINLCFTRSTTTCLKTACSRSSTTPSSLPVEMENIAIAIALDMPRNCMSKPLLCSSKLARCCMCLYECSVTV